MWAVFTCQLNSRLHTGNIRFLWDLAWLVTWKEGHCTTKSHTRGVDAPRAHPAKKAAASRTYFWNIFIFLEMLLAQKSQKMPNHTDTLCHQITATKQKNLEKSNRKRHCQKMMHPTNSQLYLPSGPSSLRFLFMGVCGTFLGGDTFHWGKVDFGPYLVDGQQEG